MTDMFEIKEFFVEGGNQEKSHVLLHITEPSTPEEWNKGYFFALAEIKKGNLEQINHLQKLIDDLESGYYETDSTTHKSSFESTLEFVNKRGHKILEFPYSEINLVVGIVGGQEISFSYFGKPTITVMYESKQGPKLVDILDGEENNSEQLFSSVLQGKINEGDYFYIATASASEFVPPDRVQKIIISKTPSQAVKHIETILSGISSDQSFGGVIFHLLSSTQKGRGNQITNDIHEKSHTTSSGNKKTLNQITSFLLKAGASILLRFFELTKKILIDTSRAFIGLILIITNRGGQRQIVLDSLQTNYKKKKKYFAELPIISKLLILLIFITGVFLLSGFIYLGVKNKQEQALQEYKQLVEEINSKKNLAETSLIYGDNNKAVALIDEAKIILNSLPNPPKEDKGLKENLATDLNKISLKANKITLVETKLIADLKTINPEANTDRLTGIQPLLLAFGKNDSSAYSIDIDTKKIQKISHEFIKKIFTGAPSKTQNLIVFISEPNKIVEFDKEKLIFTEKDIPMIRASSTWQDIYVFNQRLYILDTGNKQIFRFNKTQSGYDKGTPWLLKTEALEESTSLAIDGDVYVLKNNQILKFSDGKKEPFEIAGLSPNLSSANQIYTHNKLNNLYILEGGSKRLIVLSKNGSLINQYMSENWKNPTGLFISEDEKQAFILDDNKIYQISL